MIELVPITSVYAGLLALLIVALSARVAMMRRKQRIGYGDGDNIDLGLAIRAHANFIEYVPLALILMALLEMNGLRSEILHTLGSTLLVARVMHAWGLSKSKGVTVGRLYGTAATWLMIAAAGVLNLVN